MKAEPLSLIEKFIKESFGSQYIIPVYQRNYTWSKNKQVKKVLIDIKNIINKKEERHFMGTIVYVRVKNESFFEERAVVDGQQRLITIFLVLHALREILSNEENKEYNKLAEIIKNTYLENNLQGDQRYRLIPSIVDGKEYRLIADGKSYKIDGEVKNNIIESFLFIKESLIDLISNHGISDVFNACKNLYIVRIELDEHDNAQQIFESINSTGERLTASDLIRNYILMNKENEKQEFIYKTYWLEIETILTTSSEMENFFRYFLASQQFFFTTKKELYTAFKTYWKNIVKKNSEEWLLKKIVDYAVFYKEFYLSNRSSDFDEEIQDFRKLQSQMPAPFLLGILELHHEKKITDQQVKEILQLVNTYLLRRYFSGEDTSAITRVFPTFLKSVLKFIDKYGTKDIVTICKYVIVNSNKQKSMFMPSDQVIKQFLLNTNFYVLNLNRWFLDKIENHDNPIKLSTDLLTLEHIMPQKKTEYWQSISETNDEEYELIVNTIGNLTLASRSDNSQMQNYDFKRKKNILEKTGHLQINQYILKQDIWNKEQIERRSLALIKKFLELFPYQSSDKDFSLYDDEKIIFLNIEGIRAEGRLIDNNKVTIHIGSQIKISKISTSEKYVLLRDELIDKEIIIDQMGIYVFDQEYTFNSVSQATEFILGVPKNGWKCWKDKFEDSIEKYKNFK